MPKEVRITQDILSFVEVPKSRINGDVHYSVYSGETSIGEMFRMEDTNWKCTI